MNQYLERAKRLHQHLYETHWTGGGLEGPDPGVRFNARVGRFIKSYLRFIPWGERYYYLQAQGYWIHANWMLYDLLGDEQYRDIAVAGSNLILERQKPEGYWQYPFPEWGGRVATVEGCYAALGMLHTYRRTKDERLAAGASRWYSYLKKEIGFREEGDTLAVQYFARMEELAKNKLANIQLGRCPNNSTLLVMMTGEAYDATKDPVYLEHKDRLINFLKFAQTPEGKFPYIVPYRQYPGKDHYLCFQYNAFQLLDLARYHEVSGDASVVPILSGLARFLSRGVAADGSSKYDSFHDTPFIPYYTGVLGAALDCATELGLGDYTDLSARLYHRLARIQRKDGSFPFSYKNYGILWDARSYPRPLSMILKHLIMRARVEEKRNHGNGAQLHPHGTRVGIGNN
jgi:hypothetical protein